MREKKAERKKRRYTETPIVKSLVLSKRSQRYKSNDTKKDYQR